MRLFIFACINAATFSAAVHFFGAWAVVPVTIAYFTGIMQGMES